ncbi:MAG: hypothetical protein KC731_32200 [Myxococcales bacterium]|nr:hypothetical protein [Myxococcales bacterium]
MRAGSRPEDWTREALEERCDVLEPGIIRIREVPGGRLAPFETLLDIAGERGKEFPAYALILDLAEASRPSAELIDNMTRLFAKGAKHWCINMEGANRVMIAAGEFLLRRFYGQLSVTVHSTTADAIATAREKLAAP